MKIFTYNKRSIRTAKVTSFWAPIASKYTSDPGDVTVMCGPLSI